MDDTKISVYLVPIAVIIAGGLIALSLWSQTSSPQKPETENTNIEQVGKGTLPPLGSENAPVVFVEFGDFQCSFCAKFLKDTENVLRERFVSSGKMKIYWRDYASLGEESRNAALAARCANEQGKFWHYHDLLFFRQKGENKGGFSKENLIKIADELGLAHNQFEECLNSEKYLTEVAEDVKSGQDLGVQGTPTVFINGERVVGAQSLELFLDTINKYLK